MNGRIAAVVLAGGQSSRMGRPKALLAIGGAPLALHVARRLEPQAETIYLNVRAADEELAALGFSLVFDAETWRGAGPLAGVAAALARARADGYDLLATAPCDAPFLPLDLVARLFAAGAPAVAVSAFGREPMFALWPVDALPEVEAALAAGRRSPRAVLDMLSAARVEFASGVPDPFANLNTPEEFAAAAARFDDNLLERAQLASASPLKEN